MGAPLRPRFSVTPWVRRLLIANAAVYLLSITLFTGGWFFQLFAFSPLGAARQPWTFLSYMFLHQGFLHLAFNLLILFFFGSAVEDRMGGLAFLRYYLLCGLGGAALSFVIALFTTVDPFVGASAAIFGVSLAFAWRWPDAPVFVFPFPFPIKVKWLVALLAGIDLALAVSQAGDGVAHLAHLGGFLFGLTYLRVEALRERRARAVIPTERTARVLVKPSAEQAQGERPAPRRPRSNEAVQKEVDRVLDKISATGIASLTPDERRFLDDMSRQMRKT